LADAPRPFLFRAPHLDGLNVEPKESFYFDLHLFDLRPQITAYFISAFQQFAESGIGPSKGAARLVAVDILDATRLPASQIFNNGLIHANVAFPPVEISLTPHSQPVKHVSIQFQTPTELRKNQPTAEPPPFVVLLARLRDRISNLITLYGSGQPDFDFAGLSARAQTITIEKASLINQQTNRFSGRHSASHPIGGFLGTMQYAGDLAEFLPILKAGEWTGVGRHTVWGNGQIEIWTR
jgi:hypothetical protein